MSEIVYVPFHGTVIHSTLLDGEPHVVLRPTLTGMGLNYGAQLEKLKTRSWATVRHCRTVGTDGKDRVMDAVSLDSWAMLLANIDERRVTKAVRPLVVKYQTESARVLREYWTGGRTVNPKVSGDGYFEPHTLTWDETTALLRQRYGLALTVNELTRMLRTAGVLKQNGAPRKAYQHCFWFTGSSWTVHPHVIPELAGQVVTTGRELQEFRFIQARLELDGVGREVDAA